MNVVTTLPGAVTDDGCPSSRNEYVIVPPASVTLTTLPPASVVLVELIPSLVVVTLVPLYDHEVVFPEASTTPVGRP